MKHSSEISFIVSRKRFRFCEINMKLEMDLLRDLLIFVENNALRPHSDLDDIELPPWGEDQVAYHVTLAEEAGLLIATIDTLPDDDDRRIVHTSYSVHRLTMRGHDLLVSVADPTTWETVKSGAKKVGSLTVGAVFDIAIAYAKQRLSAQLGVAL
jgi:hypothetical protein